MKFIKLSLPLCLLLALPIQAMESDESDNFFALFSELLRANPDMNSSVDEESVALRNGVAKFYSNIDNKILQNNELLGEILVLLNNTNVIIQIGNNYFAEMGRAFLASSTNIQDLMAKLFNIRRIFRIKKNDPSALISSHLSQQNVKLAATTPPQQKGLGENSCELSRDVWNGRGSPSTFRGSDYFFDIWDPHFSRSGSIIHQEILQARDKLVEDVLAGKRPTFTIYQDGQTGVQRLPLANLEAQRELFVQTEVGHIRSQNKVFATKNEALRSIWAGMVVRYKQAFGDMERIQELLSKSINTRYSDLQ
jgi:hypothetical protein